MLNNKTITPFLRFCEAYYEITIKQLLIHSYYNFLNIQLTIQSHKLIEKSNHNIFAENYDKNIYLHLNNI